MTALDLRRGDAIPIDVIEGGAEWCVVTGDWSIGSPALPVASVGHVITDPPYDEHVHSSGRRGHTGYIEGEKSQRATFNRNRDLGFEPITVRDMEAASDWFDRVAQRWVIVFCALEQVADWRGALSSADLEAVRVGVWVKLNATPQFTGDRPAVGAEGIIIASKPGKKRWNGGGRHAVWTHPIVLNRGDGEEREHPTQKPLDLMLALVRDFTDPGEVILDPFCGSGTTGVACRRLGRRFIGFELNPEWAAIARRRIGEANPQPDLIANEAFRRAAKVKRKQTALALPEPSDPEAT